MSDILAEIERRKRWEREILRDALRGDLRVPPDSPWLPSPEALKQAKRFLKQGGCEPRGRDFEAALRAEAQLSVIAEVKRASPSAGRIASWQDPDELATAYREAGADALSVLTDAHYFDGRPGFLGRCRDLFPGPLLRKDFLADEADLAISAALGADAVLLIVASLGPRVADLRRLAGAYGLHTLIEVHKRGELDLAMAAGASIIGINNRDLETFRTDLETSERLAALLPDFVCVVAESGIKVPADAERMRRAGADAVLVGESLSRAGGVGLPALRTTLPRGSRA